MVSENLASEKEPNNHQEKNADVLETVTTVIPSDSNQNYPRRIKLAVIIASLAISVFLCALDETIITTAIPHITDEFHSIDDVGWYGSAYFMTFASFQLIYGNLFSFYSIKNVFLASIAIFEAGSLICATAPMSTVFIVGRACAGLGSAGINAGFIIILAASLPLERRPIFVSSYSSMYAIAAVAAPLLGGAFTTKATWRWCFYINLPLGGIALVAIALFFHPPPNLKASSTTWREKVSQMDLLGTAVLAPAVTAVMMVAFVIIQIWKQDKATVPPRIIKQRSVACSVCYVFHAGGALNVFEYYLPIWFQAIQGVSAFDSGERILPTTLGTALFSFVSGYGVSKTGYYTPFMILGAALSLIGASLTTTWKVASPPAQWIGYQVIIGAGAGLGIQQAHTAAQTVLASADVPTGAVVLIFAKILGSTLWLSVAENVMTGQLLRNLRDAAVPGLDPNMILNVGATGLRDAVGLQYLDVVLKVYNFALTRTFYCGVALAAAAFIASVGMEWKSIRRASN